MKWYQIVAAGLLAAVSAQAGWDSQGVPDNLIEDTEVSTALLRDIDRVLPERGQQVPDARPEFFSGDYSSNIYLSQKANVKVTFVHEGAGYRNSFGYFTYTADTVPTHASEVDLIPVFPNSSYAGSGGGLRTGNTVQIGPFDAGTYVGFWVKANAWNRWTQTVGSGYWTHFTLPHLNTEINEDKKQHVAMFWHEESEKLIMGFEDIHRENRGCDQDFNDLIFFAVSDPIEAMEINNFVTIDADMDSDNDGAPDNSDVFPDDPERASVSYYPAEDQHNILAFEDNFPSKGDYDFNDLVVTYQSQEIRNASNDLKELVMNMKVKAMGAMFHNGFAIQFPFSPDSIQSASLLINGSPSEFYPVEYGHESETVINIMFAVPHHIDGYTFPNTLEGTQERRGDRFELRLIFKDSVSGVNWPYNPFIYINQDRGREVHLAGKQPTEFVNESYFNKLDDSTQLDTDHTYKDLDGMPFAMLLPQEWEWPIEFVDITNAYPKFISWAESNGTLDNDWVYTKIDSLIWSPNDSTPGSDDFNNDAKAGFWADIDLGNKVSLIEEIDRKLKITSAAADVWGSRNNYAARYTTLDGDFDVSVMVESQDYTHPWAKAGLMIKGNITNPNENLIIMAVTPGNGFAFQYDWRGNGELCGHKGVWRPTQNQNNYVRVVRNGDILIGYHKQDSDSEWIETGRKWYGDMPDSLHIGIFSVSHSYDYGTTVFDDFIINQ